MGPAVRRPARRPSVSTFSIRDLARKASGVVEEVTRTGRPALVTKHGAPVAAVVPLDAGDVEDLVLARAPEYLADLAAGEEDIAAGRTVPLHQALAELDTDER